MNTNRYLFSGAAGSGANMLQKVLFSPDQNPLFS